MKCAYKAVQKQQNIERFCSHYGMEFLKYTDASLAVNMHELFGFGSARRLPEMFDEMNPRLNAQMQTLVEYEGEDVWYTTQNTYLWTGRKVADAVGWNPCDMAKEMPVPDHFKPQNFSRQEARNHAARVEYISSMEIKLGLYWHMVLLYLTTDHGFGAARLERLYRALRRDYIAYAVEFLKGTPSSADQMSRMLAEMRDRVRQLGIEFDYGDGGKLKVRKEVTA